MDAAMATPAEKRAEAAIEAVSALSSRLNAICGLPLTLREAGVKKDDFAKVAEFAVNDGALIVNPRAADESQVIEILNAAY
jgi:alcohol dehydrogenase